MSGHQGRRTRGRWAAALVAALAIAGTSLLGAGAAQAAPITPSPTPAPTPASASAPASAPLATTVTMTTPSVLDYGAPIDLAATVVDSTGAPAVGTVQFEISGGETFATPIELVDGAAHVVFGSILNGSIDPYVSSPPSLAIGATFVPADPTALAPAHGSSEVTIRKGVTVVTASSAGDQLLLPSTPVMVRAELELQGFARTSYWLPAETTGTVDFLLDGVTVATSAVVPNREQRRGVAVAQITLPAQGSGTLTAVYSGDATYASSTSAPVTMTVARPSASPSAAPAPVKTAPRPTIIPAPPRSDAPVTPQAETPVEAPPASSPVAISATPVADVGPLRGLVLTGLVAALLLLAAMGALITLRLRRR